MKALRLECSTKNFRSLSQLSSTHFDQSKCNYLTDIQNNSGANGRVLKRRIPRNSFVRFSDIFSQLWANHQPNEMRDGRLTCHLNWSHCFSIRKLAIEGKPRLVAASEKRNSPHSAEWKSIDFRLLRQTKFMCRGSRIAPYDCKCGKRPQRQRSLYISIASQSPLHGHSESVFLIPNGAPQHN